MSALTPMIEAYLAGPVALRRQVADMTREHLLARPIAGKWNTLEVICHLADFEPILADRMKRIIAEERPLLIGTDQNDFAAKLAYSNRELSEELAIIESVRAQVARILRTLPDSALQRDGVHSERGLVTLQQQLTLTTNHILHHLEFIIAKRKALGLAT